MRSIKFPLRPKRKRPSEWALKEDMQQRWTINSWTNRYYDQYGFEIFYTDPESKPHYRLYRFDEFICNTHTLNAAKLISTILINDQIER